MTMHSFKARFIEPIEIGIADPDDPRAKGGTIRAPRKNGHVPKVGSMLQFYTGPRMRPRKFIPDQECRGAERVQMDLEAGTVVIGVDSPDREPMVIIGGTKMLDAFARFDGFENWKDLRAFWDEEHGGTIGIARKFEGFHIRWLPWPKALVP